MRPADSPPPLSSLSDCAKRKVAYFSQNSAIFFLERVFTKHSQKAFYTAVRLRVLFNQFTKASQIFWLVCLVAESGRALR
jgi:hypothetical protein